MEDSAVLVEYTVGDLKLEVAAQKAYVNERPLALSSKGFLILHSLALRIHQDRPRRIAKEELLFNLYGPQEHWPKSNSFDVLLNRLRGALMDAQSEWEIIPVRKSGYELSKRQ